jgi:osmotically-inducible protein OsmY
MYYFDRNWEDSVHYDLTINTQRLSVDTAVQIICNSVKDENLVSVKANSKKVLSDLILRKRVEIAVLSAADIDAYLLEITVENGVVTLSGQVHSRAEKKAAEVHARSIEGISNVQNNIGVVEYRTNPLEH